MQPITLSLFVKPIITSLWSMNFGVAIGGSYFRTTYEHTTLSKEDVLSNHKSVINNFGICMDDMK